MHSQISVTSTSTSSGHDYTGDPATGAFIIYDGTNWNPSSTDGSNSGLLIDGNTFCFTGAACDANIDWNGSDIIFNG